jgi:translation initiation factor IF-3
VKIQEPQHLINEKINLNQIRIVGEHALLNVLSKYEALQIADKLELDLVLISKNGDTGICQIINYNKFLYGIKKKKKEEKKRQVIQEIKELRFGPNIVKHDFDFKLKQAEKFLVNGNIIKAVIFFRGREIQHACKGEIILLKLASELMAVGLPDNVKPKLEGKKMIMMIKPKKKNKI